MTCILVDTCVFMRLEGIFITTLDCILVTTDVIAITKKIIKEYEGRAKGVLFFLQSFLQKLEHEGKLKYFDSSFIESAVRRHENVRRINYPTHNKDRKWVRIAIATKSKYIVSTDPHLLRLASNRCNSDTIEAIEPSQYVMIRCPNNN